MKTKTLTDPWKLSPDLRRRTVAYARRTRIRDHEVVGDAVFDWFISKPELRTDLGATLAKVALDEYVALVELLDVTLTPPGRRGPEGKAEAERPQSRSKLPGDLASLTTSASRASRLHSNPDELLHSALAVFFSNGSIPSELVDEFRPLVVVALTHYLDNREPPVAGGDRPKPAARRSDN